MNLAILCGALEPGKDGVGDYSRRLAQACRGAGHNVLLGSLNDAWAQPSEPETDGPEFRLSQDISWAERAGVTQTKLARFQPDIVSLQLVPYAYHPRGFFGEMVREFTPWAREFIWQIMFHELWLGLNSGDSLKFKLTGWWQKRCALSLFRALAPAAVHTQTGAYIEFLAESGISAKRLPLFSNIDLRTPPALEALFNLLRQHGADPESRSSETPVFVFFGSLHREWSPDLLIEKLARRKPLFVSIGRQGATGQIVWNAFVTKFQNQATFVDLGEQPPEIISALFQWADAGVAATPWNLIEKSGSVAAMREHGLPVVVTRNDFLPARFFEPEPAAGLYPIWREDFHFEKLARTSAEARLPGVVARFLTDLQITSAAP